VAGGTLDALRSMLNIDSDDQWKLIVGWLVHAFAPSGPFAVLALYGEQGSAKSTLARFLRALVDPYKVDLQTKPKNDDDLYMALRHNRVLGIDNLSSISEALSDVLARISTGAGVSKRSLFTDDDLHDTRFCAPIVITSIPLVIEGGDLLERAISVRCPVIPDAKRRTETELWAEYERLKPSLLGALLNGVVMALRRKSSIHLQALPRMADHVLFVTAAEPAFEWPDGSYVHAFTTQHTSAITDQVGDDPIASRLVAYLKTHDGLFRGTASELRDALTPDKPPAGWPRNASAFAGQMDRLAPSLRRLGIDVSRPPRGHGGVRVLEVRRKPVTTVTTPPTASESVENRNDSAESSGDGRGDGHHNPSSPAPSPTPATGDVRLGGTDRPSPRPSPRNGHKSPGKTPIGDGGDGGDGLAGSVHIQTHDVEEVPNARYF
jgi:hypothetical protein